MSTKAKAKAAKNSAAAAQVFAALGDQTRVELVERLCDGSPSSISQLSAGSALSRQGITTHLRALEQAGLVSSEKIGRESLYRYNTQPLHDAKSYIDVVSQQWDQAFDRLKLLLEERSRSPGDAPRDSWRVTSSIVSVYVGSALT